MARFRQVTRTIEFTKASIMAVNTTDESVSTVEVQLSGTFDSNEKLLKAAQDSLEDGLTAVHVKSAEVLEKTFCMPETMFIENAMPLPIGKKTLKKADFEAYYAETFEGDDEPTNDAQ